MRFALTGVMTAYSISTFILILLFTYYMGYNDGANAIASATVTRAFKPRTALIVAAATKFVVPIALYAIGYAAVASTISEGLVSVDAFQGISQIKAFTFLCTALVSALIWGLASSLLHLPNATSYTLMGGIIGSGIAAFGFDSLIWETVGVKIILMCFIAPVAGFGAGFVIMRLLRTIFLRSEYTMSQKATLHLQRINMVILSAAFAVNNVQKSMGVYLLAVVAGICSAGAASSMPMWMVVVFSAAISLGLLTGGTKLVNTIGRRIYRLRPIHSLASLCTTNIIMVFATVFGIPLSAGQVVSSSIMGVGAEERVHSVRWQVAGKIVAGWWLTLPVVAALSACLYLFVANVILGGI